MGVLACGHRVEWFTEGREASVNSESLWNGSQLRKLQTQLFSHSGMHQNYLGGLGKHRLVDHNPESLFQWDWVGFAVLTCFQVVPTLLVQATHFEDHWTTASFGGVDGDRSLPTLACIGRKARCYLSICLYLSTFWHIGIRFSVTLSSYAIVLKFYIYFSVSN